MTTNMCTHVCQNFVLLLTFLFARALLGKTTTRTRETRPDTLIGLGPGAIRAL